MRKVKGAARIAAFDHTMWFAYGVEAANGREADPDVRFWRDRAGEVDFVFEVGVTTRDGEGEVYPTKPGIV